MLKHDSLADIPEHVLVKRLMADAYWRSSLLRIEGLPDRPVSLQSVPLRGLPGHPKGDIDILLFVPSQPDLAAAIQVKRIKVGAAALRNRSPNKLRAFDEGVRQANLLAAIGFSQVYLDVFVLVDSRQRNQGRVTYDGLTPELKAVIEQTLSTRNLDKRVGLMSYEFVQPMDEEALATGASARHLIRRAESLAQAPEVTAWVAQLANSTSS